MIKESKETLIESENSVKILTKSKNILRRNKIECSINYYRQKSIKTQNSFHQGSCELLIS